MSMTYCPDCGKKVSTLARSCPHCGLSGEHIYGGGGGGSVLEGLWTFCSRFVLFFGSLICFAVGGVGSIVCLFTGRLSLCFIFLAIAASGYGLWKLLSYINKD